MRRDDVQRDDVDPLPDPEDVPLVARVPERGCVAEVGLRGQEELKRHVLRSGRMVVRAYGAA